MRLHLIAASALALCAADGASAQRMVMPGPGVGNQMAGRASGMGYSRPGVAPASRWGSRVNGHWWAGVNAPGGWNAYRRPVRGWNLPSYWVAPSFAIADWSTYGLGAPPSGYGWTRYYDDAVLVDGNGRIYDCVSGVDWDRGAAYAYDTGVQGYDTVYSSQQGYSAAPGYVQPTYGQSTYGQSAYGQSTYSQSGYADTSPYAATAGYAPGASYAPPAPPPPQYGERRNSGVGGAVVGAGVGAVAGNLIGGRGHRLEGTLIGAGVGGVAGYAIARSATHRVPVAPREGYGYPPPPPASPYPPAGAGYAPPLRPGPARPERAWHSPDGGTIVTTTSAGGYNGGSTTVVTIQTAPVVTTTTTEIVEDHVTYSRHKTPHHKWVRRRPVCGC